MFGLCRKKLFLFRLKPNMFWLKISNVRFMPKKTFFCFVLNRTSFDLKFPMFGLKPNIFRFKFCDVWLGPPFFVPAVDCKNRLWYSLERTVRLSVTSLTYGNRPVYSLKSVRKCERRARYPSKGRKARVALVISVRGERWESRLLSQ